MSQTSSEIEILGLSNHDGFDIKILFGPDSVKVIHKIGHAVVSTSQNPSTVLQNSPQTGTPDNSSNCTRHLTSHDKHDMTLITSDRYPYKCSGCKESGIGDRYKCNEECPYILHPHCRHHKVEANHEFFNGSTFKFFEEHSNKEHKSCVACGSNIKGYFYHCDVTNKSIHPCCLNLQKIIEVGKMKFLLCKKLTSTCFYCNSNKKENMENCWCYSLEGGQDFQAHVSCMNDMINKCLSSESKEKRRNTKRSKKLRITVLLKWAKHLRRQVIEFLKSSNTHVENTIKFLNKAKIELEKIIECLELLEKALSAVFFGSTLMNLGTLNAYLGGVILFLEGLRIVLRIFLLCLESLDG